MTDLPNHHLEFAKTYGNETRDLIRAVVEAHGPTIRRDLLAHQPGLELVTPDTLIRADLVALLVDLDQRPGPLGSLITETVTKVLAMPEAIGRQQRFGATLLVVSRKAEMLLLLGELGWHVLQPTVKAVVPMNAEEHACIVVLGSKVSVVCLQPERSKAPRDRMNRHAAAIRALVFAHRADLIERWRACFPELETGDAEAIARTAVVLVLPRDARAAERLRRSFEIMREIPREESGWSFDPFVREMDHDGDTLLLTTPCEASVVLAVSSNATNDMMKQIDQAARPGHLFVVVAEENRAVILRMPCNLDVAGQA